MSRRKYDRKKVREVVLEYMKHHNTCPATATTSRELAPIAGCSPNYVTSTIKDVKGIQWYRSGFKGPYVHYYWDPTESYVDRYKRVLAEVFRDVGALSPEDAWTAEELMEIMKEYPAVIPLRSVYGVSRRLVGQNGFRLDGGVLIAIKSLLDPREHCRFYMQED